LGMKHGWSVRIDGQEPDDEEKCGTYKDQLLKILEGYLKDNPTDPNVMDKPYQIATYVPDGWKVTRAKSIRLRAGLQDRRGDRRAQL